MAQTFTDITNEVQNSLARNDATVTGMIPTWVNRRQRMAASRHNFNFMRSATPAAISILTTTQTYPLPADFKGDIVFFLLETSAYTLIQKKAENELITRWGPQDKGKPQFVSLRDGNLLIWPPTSDTTYTLDLLYWQYPADLSGTQTNWFTANAARMLVAGGLAEGYGFLGATEDAAFWEAQYAGAPQEAGKGGLVGQAISDDISRAPQEDVITLYGLGVHYRPTLVGTGLSILPDWEDRVPGG